MVLANAKFKALASIMVLPLN